MLQGCQGAVLPSLIRILIYDKKNPQHLAFVHTK